MNEPSEAFKQLTRMEQRASVMYTPCGSGQMVWRIWGNGPPLLLVHGGAGAWNHWFRNLPVLAQSHTVIAADTPGLGDSARPTSPYSPESIADIMAAGLPSVMRKHVRGETPTLHIAGFSFGGMIAGLVAERVVMSGGCLILLGASGLGGRFNELAPIEKLPSGAKAEELMEVHRRNLQIMMLHNSHTIDEMALAIQSINAPKTRVRSPQHALSCKLSHSLLRSGVRFHSLWGEHCIFASDLPRRRALLQSIYPNTQFRVIAGAGHWVQYEAAAVVNDQLCSWLESGTP